MLVLILAFSLLLSACGSTESGAGDPAGGVSVAEGSNEKEEKESSGKITAGGVALRDYEDPDFGYTMLSPDESVDGTITGDDLGCTVWIISDKDDEEVMMVAFMEYEEDSPRFSETPDEFASPEQLLDLFEKHIKKVMGVKLTLHPSGLEASAYTYEKAEAGELDAVRFKGALKCDNEKTIREYGFTGVCVQGEKRPYVFWAIDLTEDMSMTDAGAQIIGACVRDFREGN